MLKNQLREAIAAGKTQQETADFLGINYSTYSGYETGKRKTKAGTAATTCKIFLV